MKTNKQWKIENKVVTSGTVVSYGVFWNTGALSLISDTRTITGMLRFRLVDRIVHETWEIEQFHDKYLVSQFWRNQSSVQHEQCCACIWRCCKICLMFTWNIIWLRFSASRSSGCSNCSDFPFSRNIWLPFGKISSRAISWNGSPKMGNSAGFVRWLITVVVYIAANGFGSHKKSHSISYEIFNQLEKRRKKSETKRIELMIWSISMQILVLSIFPVINETCRKKANYGVKMT